MKTVGSFELVRPLPAWGSGYFLGRHTGEVDDELPARAIVRVPVAPGESPYLVAEGQRRQKMRRPPCASVPSLLRVGVGADASGSYLVYEAVPAVRLDALLLDPARFGAETPLPISFALAIVDDVAAALRALERGRAPTSEDARVGHVAVQLAFDELLITDTGVPLVLTPPVGPRPSTPGLLPQPSRERALFAPEKLAGQLPFTSTLEVYMLGALLFMLATASDPPALANLEQRDSAPSLRKYDAEHQVIDGDVPELLDATLRRAMSRDPYERHESVEELRASLRACMELFPPDDRAELVRARARRAFDEAELLLRIA